VTASLEISKVDSRSHEEDLSFVRPKIIISKRKIITARMRFSRLNGKMNFQYLAFEMVIKNQLMILTIAWIEKMSVWLPCGKMINIFSILLK